MIVRRMLWLVAALAWLNMAGFTHDEEDDHPNYIGAYGGLNFAPNQTIAGIDDPFLAVDDRELGYLAGILLGRRFGDFRVELDIARRENALDVVGFLDSTGFVPAAGDGSSFFVSGDVTVHSAMANLLYAPENYEMFGFQPFLGGGLGIGLVDYNDVGVFFLDEVFLDDADVGLATQAIAGLERQLTRHLVVQGGYRYFRALDIQLNLSNGVPVDVDYGAHSLFASLQWRFGGKHKDNDEPVEAQDIAPPAPAPAPQANRAPDARDDRFSVRAGQAQALAVLTNDRDADGDALRITDVTAPQNGNTQITSDGRIRYEAPVSFSGQEQFSYTIEDGQGGRAQAAVDVTVAPAQLPGPFIVFFDFDSANLTAVGRQVITQAAEAYRDYGVARLEAVGHTDTSGPAWYNERLAERRTQAVRQALVAAGVPQARIATDSRGESEPLVATDDGVREPQNRRVEITLQR